MKLTPKKTFLLKQVNEDGKKPKDVIARAGEPIEVTNEEAVKFAGYWKIDGESGDKDKKKINEAGKTSPGKRIV